MGGKKTTDNQGAVNVQLTIKKKKQAEKCRKRPEFLTWDGILSVWWGHSDSRGVSDALHRAQAHVVAEAQDVPAHDFG